MLWRIAKVLFGAWAFAVAGVILFAIISMLAGVADPYAYMRYASVPLFVVGIALMFRWLK